MQRRRKEKEKKKKNGMLVNVMNYETAIFFYCISIRTYIREEIGTVGLKATAE